MMKILSILLILAGFVWFMQGINLLPGSFMTGQVEWAVIGAISFAIGIGLLLFSRRSKK